MLLLPTRPLAAWAVHQLARVDYTVANRVSDDVAAAVAWAYAHDAPWLAQKAILALQFMDDVGSGLIAAVVWMVLHTR